MPPQANIAEALAARFSPSCSEISMKLPKPKRIAAAFKKRNIVEIFAFIERLPDYSDGRWFESDELRGYSSALEQPTKYVRIANS
jgi:hypothetical protein